MSYLIWLGILVIIIGMLLREQMMKTRIRELNHYLTQILNGTLAKMPADRHHDDLAELRELVDAIHSRFEAGRQELEENFHQLQLSNVTLEEKYAQAYTLQLIQEEIARELNHQELLDKTLDILVGVFGSKQCIIYMVNNDVLELKANAGFIEDPNVEKTISLNSDHLFARACREKKVLTGDKQAMGGGTSDYIAVPLYGRHNCLGVMVMENEMLRVINQDLIDFVKLIAQELSLSLENAYLYDEMRRMAIRDGLTGVYNRIYLMKYMTDIFNSSSKKISTILIDLDHFKQINDQYGHLAGDMVLKNLTRLAKEALPSGIIARYGGEEFVIVLPETSLSEAFAFANALRETVARHRFVTDDGTIIPVTMSAGVSSYPEMANSIEMLFQMADNALYKAKNSGRNQVRMAGEIPQLKTGRLNFVSYNKPN